MVIAPVACDRVVSAQGLSSETSPKQSFSQTRKRCQTHQRLGAGRRGRPSASGASGARGARQAPRRPQRGCMVTLRLGAIRECAKTEPSDGDARGSCRSAACFGASPVASALGSENRRDPVLHSHHFTIAPLATRPKPDISTWQQLGHFYLALTYSKFPVDNQGSFVVAIIRPCVLPRGGPLPLPRTPGLTATPHRSKANVPIGYLQDFLPTTDAV